MKFEEDVHVSITEQYIEENPSWVTITRDQKISDGAGGTTVSNTPLILPPQKMRLVGIEPRRGQTLIMLVTSNGEEVVANSTLICMPDADIERGDKFTLGEEGIYEILHIENHPEWRVRAEVYLHSA